MLGLYTWTYHGFVTHSLPSVPYTHTLWLHSHEFDLFMLNGRVGAEEKRTTSGLSLPPAASLVWPTLKQAALVLGLERMTVAVFSKGNAATLTGDVKSAKS